MFESKYNGLLTVLLIIVIIAIIGLLVFLGYTYYENYVINTDSSGYVDNFQTEINNGKKEEEDDDENSNTNNENILDGLDSNTSTGDSNNSSQGNTLPTFKGFGVLGTIEIPEIDLKYPILEKVTKTSLETSVAYQYGVGLNEVGNNVIIGHNYRNGVFFSNNELLEVNDSIYITDGDGEKITYKIYEMFYADPSDASFYQRDTNGAAEITLSTCSDDSSTRLIVLARAE